MEPNATIRIVASPMRTLYHHETDGKGRVVKTTGPLAYIFHYIVQSVGLRYEHVLSKEIEFGREVGPNNWTGIIGSLIRRETDMLGSFMPAMDSFADHLSFTTSPVLLEFTVLSGPPNKLRQEQGSLLSSLGVHLLTCLLLAWIALSLIYVLIPDEGFTLNKDIGSNLIGTLLVFYGLLFQRGFDRLPTSLKRRLLVTGWLFAVLVLMTVFAATLSSELVVQDVPERIDRIADILKYPDIKPYVARNLISQLYVDADPVWWGGFDEDLRGRRQEVRRSLPR